MDDPSKEENNNCCSDQGIDAVVNNNTQEETSLLVTLCDVAAAVIISMFWLTLYNTALIGNSQQSSAYARTTDFAAVLAYNHFDQLGRLYELMIRMVQSTNRFSVFEQFM